MNETAKTRFQVGKNVAKLAKTAKTAGLTVAASGHTTAFGATNETRKEFATTCSPCWLGRRPNLLLSVAPLGTAGFQTFVADYPVSEPVE
jgi:hypothetical protein